MITRVLFGKNYNIVRQKNWYLCPINPPPQANSEEYLASLLPNVLYDGGVVVYEPCDIECVGSGGLWNTFLLTVNTF